MPSLNVFYPALKTFDESESVDIMLVKGNGRALSAGGDVKFFVSAATDPLKHDQLDYFLSTVYEMFHKLGTMKKPLVTIMDGISMGYGLAVSTLPPFGVATENTKICMPETRFGHFCDVGSTFFLPRLNGHIGKYMALTAHIFQAEDAVLAGLATHFVPSDRLEDLEKTLVDLYKPTHDIVNDTIEKFAVKSDHEYSSSALSQENRAIIARCFKHDTIEEILNALEKDGSKFSKDTIDEIYNGSPIGVKLTTELHRRVAGLSLQECLRLEHYLWQSSAFQPEFKEGINTGIIKKQKPQWIYPSVCDVDMESDILMKYFYANCRRQNLHFFKDKDYHINEFSKYKLPSEEDILRKRKSENFKSDKEFVDWFVKESKNKFGVREQVEDTIYRNSIN